MVRSSDPLWGVDACSEPVLSIRPWVLRSKSVAGPGAHREKYVEDRPNVAMAQKDSEGKFTVHLLSILTNELHLCGLVRHELAGGCILFTLPSY